MTELYPTEPDVEARLHRLRRLASNLRWSWHRPVADLLAAVPGADPGRHPLDAVDELVADPEAAARFTAHHGPTIDELAAETEALEQRFIDPDVAYFCPEFGVAAQVPQYSGGLGILAGDHLKASSDLGLPLVGVGLFYRNGFFRQDITDGAQTERYETLDARRLGALDTGAIVHVVVDGETVAVRVWELWVGASRLVLLDTDVEGNSAAARSITDRLYAGDRRHRLSQELILGVGGIRALRALDCHPTAYHLNEGHACFLLLELLAEQVAAGRGLAEARRMVRDMTLFTTHTPVPAGIDRFERELVGPELGPWAVHLGVTIDDILDWACLPTDGPSRPFNTAALAFALCGRVNGVSQLHAQVSRRLFQAIPEARTIEGVTNGVHARTWVDPELQRLYDAELGAGWDNGDPEAWARIEGVATDALFEVRARARRRLIDLVYGLAGVELDPGACIFGFARRFATYKRAALILRDPEGMARSVEAGARFVFAGKAHPADTEGKAVLAELARYSAANPQGGVILLPDYDIDIARALYAGSDVWLNNPVRPHEACGTSGEKAALNGVINCSISDGWWADWYTEGIGWVIPTVDGVDPDERDRIEAAELHRLLIDDVLRLYGGDGEAWWAMVRRMLGHLGPLVTAGRMVAEYDRRFYGPIRQSVLGPLAVAS